LYRGDEAVALNYGRKAFAISPFDWLELTFLRDYELRSERYAGARALYEQSYPELLSQDYPKIDNGNYEAAINLALVLFKTGEQERADLLLNRSFQHVQTLPRLGMRYGIAAVQIYTLRGDKQRAVSALRQAIDEGWRDLWWYFLKLKPDLGLLHDEPEFQAMVAEIEADMAAQLARVREMEKNGELEPIPEASATIQ
jgi:tetratricopeptide (TPR) repeat protein